MKTLNIIKLGGDVVDDVNRRHAVFASLRSLLNAAEQCVLVHGGGKVATELSAELGVQTRMLEGRRLTDAATLRVVTMTYAGLINKQLVAELQAMGVNALGLCGVDGNAMTAHKREHATIDYGFVGDIDAVNDKLFDSLLDAGLMPVLAPLTHNGKGQLLNTNADTIAAAVAMSMRTQRHVRVLLLMDKAGVLRDVEDESSVMSTLSHEEYKALRSSGHIAKGMIAKLDNAFVLADAGVQVHVCSWRDLSSGTLIRGQVGPL